MVRGEVRAGAGHGKTDIPCVEDGHNVSKPIRPLTSLLLVEERLLEADYFVSLMRRRHGAEFGYCLNAFVSASRSVTFLIQEEMARVPDFDSWWSDQQQAMSRDAAMRFFLKLRNYSQKEGRISLVGIKCGKSAPGRWSHRFAGTDGRVPPALLHRDVADCCVEHIAKLATVILACTERFPFHACPRMALSQHGLQELGLSTRDLAVLLGFDSRWMDAASGIPLEQELRILQGHVDGLDMMKLRRLARRTLSNRSGADMVDPFGQELDRAMVEQLEGKGRAVNVPNLIGELLLHTWSDPRGESP